MTDSIQEDLVSLAHKAWLLAATAKRQYKADYTADRDYYTSRKMFEALAQRSAWLDHVIKDLPPLPEGSAKEWSDQ